MAAYHCRVLFCRRGPLFLTAWVLAAGGTLSHAQSPATPRYTDSTDGVAPMAAIVDPPTPHAANETVGGVICGTVLDPNGAEVEGATVTLEEVSGRGHLRVATDGNGFFRFNSAEPGSFKLTVRAEGFSDWSSTDLHLRPNEDYDLPAVELGVAAAVTVVQVVSTRHDRVEEDLRAQEKQRVLGGIPNFYVAYNWDAEPLSSQQKYRLAWRTSIDPVTIFISAGIAGVEQSQNIFSGYGQGMSGYGKRFGAAYGDGFIGTFLTDAVFPSLFRQDPRYFYKGTGSIRSRALYAIGSVVICRGDNGRWQPNYSNVLGNLAAAGISNAYYPASDRQGMELTVQNSLIDTAAGAAGALFQEFLVKKISRGVQH